MARLWSSGFELQSLTTRMEWTTAESAASINTATKRTGAASLRANPTAATASTVRKDITTGAGSTNTWFLAAWINVAVLPSGADIANLVQISSFSGPSLTIAVRPSGALLVREYGSGGQIGSDSTTLIATGSWYLIQLKQDPTGNKVSARVRIDGGSDEEFVTDAAGAKADGHFIRVGLGDLIAHDVYLDDVALNDDTGSFQNTWPGNTNMLHLRPDAAGDNSAWTPDAGANYTNVDEITPNDATDVVQDKTAGNIDDYNCAASGLASDAVINAVSVGQRWRGRSLPGFSSTFVLRIKASSGGTVEESPAIPPNVGGTWNTFWYAQPRLYQLTLYDMPGASTTKWTTADLDAMQIGQRTTTTSAVGSDVSTVWALADWEPAAAVADRRRLLAGVI